VAAVAVRPVVVERRSAPGSREDDEADETPPPVRPVERPHGADGARPAARRTAVEPDLPAPQIREQIVLAPEAASEPPVIHVSIGRVELRAPAAAPAPSPVELARPKQSLDDYLLARDRRRA
jgi:hypothetical protein